MKKKRRSVLKTPSLKTLLASLAGLATTIQAEAPFGLVGGSDSGVPYAAFIDSNGNLTPVPGLPSAGYLQAVAINNSGLGIVAGANQEGILNAYAAFVSPDGTIVPFTTGGDSNGRFNYASINDNGLALIGGGLTNSGDDDFRAIYLTSDGTVLHTFNLDNDPFNLGEFNASAMNSSGVGLIGGEGGADGVHAFAAYLYSDGSSVPFENELPNGGYLFAVDINDDSLGLIGGIAGDSSAYAAFITPGKDISVMPLPAGSGSISTVAINSSGLGLVGGGIDDSLSVYAAYVQQNGTITPLLEGNFVGRIEKSAINSSGTGLIAGFEDSVGAYAAFTNPNGTVTPLFTSSAPSDVDSVAINDAGIGMMSGSSNYLVIVAPNGTITPLAPEFADNNSVAILQSIADSAVPSSAGSYSSAMYTQLAMHSTLDARFLQKNKLWSNSANSGSTVAYNDAIFSEDLVCQSPQGRSMPKKLETKQKPNSIWFEPFGDYIHLKDQGNIPSYSNTLGGGLLGYDYEGANYLVGSAVGYAFNYIAYSQHIGHAKLQEEMLSVYGSYYTDHFWVDASLWAGLYQLKTTRHTLEQISSLGSTHGYLFTPHIGMASPWQIGTEDNYYIEPFFSLDWINNWQNAYTETGASGLNLQMPSIYSSLLQSEAGLRFYERVLCSWGQIRLEQKLSYVNQAPFNFDPVTTSFVASASSFPVAIGSSRVQNMGAFQFLGCFVPNNIVI